MNPNLTSPLAFHRFRRDHQLRLIFSAAQRQTSGKPTWIRPGSPDVASILDLLGEAIYHSRETLRQRTMEWPDSAPDESDKKLERFLVELREWFLLLNQIVVGAEDPRPHLQPLLEARLRLGQQLFHASRHPSPAMPLR
jgi:hypothetical protein